MEPSTIAIHAGLAEGVTGAPVLSPLVLATSFHSHPDAIGFSATNRTERAPQFYARWGNPTAAALEERLANARPVRDWAFFTFPPDRAGEPRCSLYASCDGSGCTGLLVR